MTLTFVGRRLAPRTATTPPIGAAVVSLPLCFASSLTLNPASLTAPSRRAFSQQRPPSTTGSLLPASTSSRPSNYRIWRSSFPLGRPTQTRHLSLPSVLGAASDLAATSLSNLHLVTGTPWYITIPLFALCVNLLLRLPSILYTRRGEVNFSKARPLLVAIRNRLRATVDEASHEIPRLQKVDPLRANEKKKVYRETIDTGVAGIHRVRAIYKLPTTGRTLATALVPLPGWILGIEAVRRIAGLQGGWIAVLTGRASKVETSTPPPAPIATDFPDEAVPLPSSETTHLSPTAPHALPPNADLPSELLPMPSMVDPTLATEGCLWFADLSAPDPLHILPFLLSAALLTSLLTGGTSLSRVFNLRGADMPTTFLPRLSLRLYRVGLVFACAIGPLTMAFPAAMHLYWIASVASSQAILHAMKLALPKPAFTAPPTAGALGLMRPTRRWQERLEENLAKARAARMAKKRAPAKKVEAARRPGVDFKKK